MAHTDGHCGTIVSVQLRGTKRWRLMPLPQLHGSLYKFDEADGGAYRANRSGWYQWLYPCFRSSSSLASEDASISQFI